jgi:hypothetical protein
MLCIDGVAERKDDDEEKSMDDDVISYRSSSWSTEKAGNTTSTNVATTSSLHLEKLLNKSEDEVEARQPNICPLLSAVHLQDPSRSVLCSGSRS